MFPAGYGPSHVKEPKALTRFFSGGAEGDLAKLAGETVGDGEIVSPGGFEALQQRLHLAASRVAKLSEKALCQMILFDLLALEGALSFGDTLVRTPEPVLQAYQNFWQTIRLRLGKATQVLRMARGWLSRDEPRD